MLLQNYTEKQEKHCSVINNVQDEKKTILHPSLCKSKNAGKLYF